MHIIHKSGRNWVIIGVFIALAVVVVLLSGLGTWIYKRRMNKRNELLIK